MKIIIAALFIFLVFFNGCSSDEPKSSLSAIKEVEYKSGNVSEESLKPQSVLHPDAFLGVALTDKSYMPLLKEGAEQVAKNSDCGTLTLASQSTNKGTDANPVFFYTCDKGNGPFNVFLSKSEIIENRQSNKSGNIPKPISQTEAEDLCKAQLPYLVNYPETIIYKPFTASFYSAPNGNGRWQTDFQAKNGLKQESNHHLNCLVTTSKKVEISITSPNGPSGRTFVQKN